MPNTYDVGDKVRCTGVFTNVESGEQFDPTTVKFTFKEPDGTTTTYTYGTDAELVKEAVGEYYVDIDLNAAGNWHYRMFAEGTGQTAAEETMHVRKSQVS